MNMIRKELSYIFSRDIEKVIKELEFFQNEQNIWKTEGAISNSAGNLALHLIGNLNHYIGKKLGNTDYVRQRELEFTNKNISRYEIVSMLKSTEKVVKDTLDTAEFEMDDNYDQDFLEKEYSNRQFLFHLIAHLNYHLGQINYLRRILE
jgi:uncharacterized damage-inducible protein DinB